MALNKSYRVAVRVSRQASSSFYPSFWLLPKPKRLAMCAFYAFARLTDDVADCDVSTHAKREWLSRWRSIIENSCDGNRIITGKGLPDLGATAGVEALAVLPSLVDTANRYRIETRLLLEIIDGAMSDQEVSRMNTFHELEDYCYLVASTVGLICLRIWEFDGEQTEAAAIECGRAFQLTNILRDIREDHARGRFYLPLDDATEFGIDVDRLLPSQHQQWSLLLQRQCERASQAFDRGWCAYPGIHRDGQRMFSMMWRSYRSLLEEIQHDPLAVLHRRVRLSTMKKLSIASTHFVRPVFERLPLPIRTAE